MNSTVEVLEVVAREIRWVAYVRGQAEEDLIREAWQEFTKPLRLDTDLGEEDMSAITDGRYQHTINWAYTQAAGDKTPREKRKWVTDFLLTIRHYDAAEEHMRFLDGLTDDELDSWTTGS